MTTKAQTVGGALLKMAESSSLQPTEAKTLGGVLRAHYDRVSGLDAPAAELAPEGTGAAETALVEEKEDVEALLEREPTPRQRTMLERQLADVKNRISLFEAGKRAGRAER